MKWIFIIKTSKYLLIQYVIIVLFLIFFYQGGYRFQPYVNHFVFDKTYLSDLGRTHYFSGVYNPYWWIYTLTLSLVGIGTFLFFYILSININKKVRYIILLFSYISAFGYIGIAVNPVDIHLKTHILYGNIAFFSFIIPSFLLMIFTYRKANPTQFYPLLILNIFLAWFLAFQLLASPTVNERILQTKVLAQKTIVIVQLFISIYLLSVVSKTEVND